MPVAALVALNLAPMALGLVGQVVSGIQMNNAQKEANKQNERFQQQVLGPLLQSGQQQTGAMGAAVGQFAAVGPGGLPGQFA